MEAEFIHFLKDKDTEVKKKPHSKHRVLGTALAKQAVRTHSSGMQNTDSLF